MKTEEDEAFDDLARRQGMWGGGFPAKRAMAADKVQDGKCKYCVDGCIACDARAQPAQEQEEDWGALAKKQLASIKRDTQASFEDAMVRATHKVMAEREAQPAQEPECVGLVRIAENLRRAGASIPAPELTGTIEGSVVTGLCIALALVESEIDALAQPTQQEAIYGMNQDDWKDVVAAISKVRDGRGIYLGCRPADVFKDWFLALGTAKVKEKNG